MAFIYIGSSSSCCALLDHDLSLFTHNTPMAMISLPPSGSHTLMEPPQLLQVEGEHRSPVPIPLCATGVSVFPLRLLSA